MHLLLFKNYLKIWVRVIKNQLKEEIENRLKEEIKNQIENK
jgi:hypothetical protein